MKYFIPYQKKASINYIYLFCLLGLAEYNKETERYDRVRYTTLQELTERINKNYNISISNATVSRFLRDTVANGIYLSIDRKQKEIKINNDFRSKQDMPFVVIDQRALLFLIRQQDNLLCKYYLYICYYCSVSKNNNTDTTAKQFLSASGYSTSSGNYISQISKYNSLLTEKNYIKIQKYKDLQGYERNIYTLV